MVPEGSVDIDSSRLGWSPENNFFALSIGKLRIREAAEAGVLAEDVYIELSGRAFWDDGRIALSKAIIERITLMPTRVNDLPAAAGLLLPSGDGSQLGALQYISEIAVRDIRVKSGNEAVSNGSHLLMMRKGSRLSASVQIEYGPAERLSSIIGTAEIGQNGGGRAEIALSRLDPRDIGCACVCACVCLPVSLSLSLSGCLFLSLSLPRLFVCCCCCAPAPPPPPPNWDLTKQIFLGHLPGGGGGGGGGGGKACARYSGVSRPRVSRTFSLKGNRRKGKQPKHLPRK